MRRLLTTFAAAVGFAGLVGCGETRPATYPVAGVLQFDDGTPVPGATVTFRGTANGGPVEARGRVGDDGTFRLTTFADGDGVVAGDHRVTVVALPPRDSATPPPALIAGKYGDPDTSGLTATVAPDTREIVLKVAKPAKRSAGP